MEWPGLNGGSALTYYEYKRQLETLRCTCAMNQLYHQKLEWRYGIADKSIRVAVGAFTVVGLILAVPGVNYPITGLILAVVAAIAGVALNVVPVADREKVHGELFRLWSDIRADAEREEIKTRESSDDGEVVAWRAERLCDLCSKAEDMSARESAAWVSLLKACDGDALMQLFGVRTREELRARYDAECATSSVSAEAATVGAGDAAGASGAG
jgi:hypothetical protein